MFDGGLDFKREMVNVRVMHGIRHKSPKGNGIVKQVHGAIKQVMKSV